MITLVVATEMSVPMFISIPDYKIKCTELENNIGKVYDIYNCDFYYSVIQSEKTFDRCQFIVRDTTFNAIYYEKGFDEIFIKQRVNIDERIKDAFYNFTSQITIPLYFEKEGRHMITFSFEMCKYDEFDTYVLGSYIFDIMSIASYNIYYLQKDKFLALQKELD